MGIGRRMAHAAADTMLWAMLTVVLWASLMGLTKGCASEVGSKRSGGVVMRDLSEDLRDMVGDLAEGEPIPLDHVLDKMSKAADEIDRLNAALDKLDRR